MRIEPAYWSCTKQVNIGCSSQHIEAVTKQVNIGSSTVGTRDAGCHLCLVHPCAERERTDADWRSQIRYTGICFVKKSEPLGILSLPQQLENALLFLWSSFQALVLITSEAEGFCPSIVTSSDGAILPTFTSKTPFRQNSSKFGRQIAGQSRRATNFRYTVLFSVVKREFLSSHSDMK